MATLKSALTLFAFLRFSNNNRFSPKPPNSIKLHSSTSLLFPSKPSSFSTPTLCFHLYSALQETASTTTEENTEQNKTTNVKTKLYVVNLPWSLSAEGIKDLFSQCGTVTDVEIIKNKDDGRNRGYAFVTMATGEEAMDAVDKFDSYGWLQVFNTSTPGTNAPSKEISGRTIRVEFAKSFKKPPPPRSPGPPPGETRHVIYASNLAWKARSTHLRDFITENFKTPVSARVVFDSPTGRSAGYGFVSFLTKEEAEAAISALDGKELMGRPLRLKFSEKKVKEAGSEKDEDYDAQVEES